MGENLPGDDIVEWWMGSTTDTPYKMTIGADFSQKEVEIEYKGKKELVRFQIWDLAGQPRFFEVAKKYFAGAHGALVLFDITAPSTFKNVPTWLNHLTEYSGHGIVPFVIIGNKSDLRADDDPRHIGPNQARKYVKHLNNITKKYGFNVPYLETSAKWSINVDEAFKTLAISVITWVERRKKAKITSPLHSIKEIEKEIYQATSFSDLAKITPKIDEIEFSLAFHDDKRVQIEPQLEEIKLQIRKKYNRYQYKKKQSEKGQKTEIEIFSRLNKLKEQANTLENEILSRRTRSNLISSEEKQHQLVKAVENVPIRILVGFRSPRMNEAKSLQVNLISKLKCLKKLIIEEKESLFQEKEIPFEITQETEIVSMSKISSFQHEKELKPAIRELTPETMIDDTLQHEYHGFTCQDMPSDIACTPSDAGLTHPSRTQIDELRKLFTGDWKDIEIGTKKLLDFMGFNAIHDERIGDGKVIEHQLDVYCTTKEGIEFIVECKKVKNIESQGKKYIDTLIGKMTQLRREGHFIGGAIFISTEPLNPKHQAQASRNTILTLTTNEAIIAARYINESVQFLYDFFMWSSSARVDLPPALIDNFQRCMICKGYLKDNDVVWFDMNMYTAHINHLKEWTKIKAVHPITGQSLRRVEGKGVWFEGRIHNLKFQRGHTAS